MPLRNLPRKLSKEQKSRVKKLTVPEAAENPFTELTSPADYTAVDQAISDANKPDKNLYTDFSAVEAAPDAVVKDKDITEQAAVDAMAKAINDAVAALEKTNPPTSDTHIGANIALSLSALLMTAAIFLKNKTRHYGN